MTLRSRKKPPTTAQNLKATAVDFAPSLAAYGTAGKDPLSHSVAEPGTSAVSVFATVVLTLLLMMTGSVRAQSTLASGWQPARPKRSLSSTVVNTPLAESTSNTAARATARQMLELPAANWQSSHSGLEDTSTHLRWRTVRETETPKLKPHVSRAQRTPRKPLQSVSSTRKITTRTVTPVELSSRMAEMPRQVRQAKPSTQSTRRPLKQAQQTKIDPPNKLAQPIKLVQNTEDLPFPDLGNSDLLIPGDSSGTQAPSPEDIFDSAEAQPNDANPFRFRDQTPTQEPNPLPSQPRSRFENPDANPLDFDPSEAQPLDSESLSAPQPEYNAPPTDPFFQPDATIQDSSGQDSSGSSQSIPVPFSPDGNTGEAVDTEAADGDLRSTLEKQLEKLEKLPPVPGEDDEETLPSPFDTKERDNPLSLAEDEDPESSSDSASEQSTAELAVTNGRDCDTDACRPDFAYLARRERTDSMSLNITPSIEPAESNMAKVEQTRIEKLADAPSRTWTDRSGRVIADGLFDDFRHDKVYVRTVNGTLRPLPYHTLCDADRCFVNAWWELPEECNFESERFVMRDFRLTTFTWAAAGTCHKPLYFEEVAVERYGHSMGPIVQPLVSGVHFFGNIAMLPYHMGQNPPNECMYTLGHYRPGDCAPWLVPGFPFTTRGFKWEGLAIGAAIALLP